MLTLKSSPDVQLIDHMGSDASIVQAARVSVDGGKALAQDDDKLILYLMKNKHGSPFEHCTMKFLVSASIFVFREFHRHRIGFSYNEQSGRYMNLEPVFYVAPASRPMFKPEKFKPSAPSFLRIEEMPDPVEAKKAYDDLCQSHIAVYELAYDTYQKGLEAGFDPGLARACLPVGIFSSCIVTCNPRSLMNFLSLRTADDRATFPSKPLFEIAKVADQLELYFQDLFPITHDSWCARGRVAP